MDFGRTVQVMRAVRGMTQRELADAAGVNRIVVWQIESGRMLPGSEIETAVKEALHWPENADEAFAILESEAA